MVCLNVWFAKSVGNIYSATVKEKISFPCYIACSPAVATYLDLLLWVP